jgi:hypothetical protein
VESELIDKFHLKRGGKINEPHAEEHAPYRDCI